MWEGGQRQEDACLKFSQPERKVKVVLVNIDDKVVDTEGHKMKIQSPDRYRKYFQRHNKRIVPEIK